MKCWKCGQEITDDTSVCVYCGVSQSRPVPMTEAGRAMRSLYDRYGAQEVLTNSAYLVNGLGDLTDESKKLRNQLKMAMDAGVGRIYFEQLSIGTPSNDFDKRVKVLLTEDAGLSDKATSELMIYFDEMIGWRITTQPQTQSQIPTQQVEKKIPGSYEIDRRIPELSGQLSAEKTEHAPIENQKKKRKWKPLILSAVVIIVVFFLALIAIDIIYSSTVDENDVGWYYSYDDGKQENISITFNAESRTLVYIGYLIYYDKSAGYTEQDMEMLIEATESIGEHSSYTYENGMYIYSYEIFPPEIGGHMDQFANDGTIQFVYMSQPGTTLFRKMPFDMNADVFADYLQQAGFKEGTK